MATGIVITGRTQVFIGSNALGETDENNDISIKIFTPRKKIHTNLSGPELFEKIISLGIYAMITVPFIKFDGSVAAGICKGNAGSEGQLGTLGADVSSFDLKITAAASGESWDFPTAWLEDHYELSKFGYEAQKMMMTFYGQPDPATLATITTALYTNS